MPKFQIEMLWRCSTCNAENLGRNKTCGGCGKALEKESFYMPGSVSVKDAVTDPKMLRDAKAGPDWFCRYCGSSQKKSDGTCESCGASQKEKSHDRGQTKRPRVTFNAEDSVRENTKSYPKTNIFDVPHYEPKVRDKKKIWITSVIIFGVVFLSFILWLLFRERVCDVEVSKVSWKREILIDKWQILEKEGWEKDKGSFEERNLGKRVHHHDQVIDHYETESYTEQEQCGEDCSKTPQSCTTTPVVCTPNGNGYASCSGGDTVCTGGDTVCTPRYCSVPKTREVPVYRDVPVYKTWWAWKVWEWKYDRTVAESGANTDPFWPKADKLKNPHLNDGEKERQKKRESYFVSLYDGEDSYSYEPQSETEFKKFSIKSKHKISVSIINGVKVLQ